MESELRQYLFTCARAYAAATGLGMSVVSRNAANDGRFFGRLADPSVSFTARKFDEVLQWFSDNWPEGVRWPRGVPRPTRARESA